MGGSWLFVHKVKTTKPVRSSSIFLDLALRTSCASNKSGEEMPRPYTLLIQLTPFLAITTAASWDVPVPPSPDNVRVGR
jgi:hypothetical protein